VDFDGSDYAFLESTAFLVVVLALAVAAYAAERLRRARGRAASARSSGRDPVELAVGATALVAGALLFAGSLAAGGEIAWPGLPAGAAIALLGFAATVTLLGRVRRRLDASAAALLPVWADAAALGMALVAIVFPPAALLVLLALAYLLVAAGREQRRKYEGLRVLR
jgi:hypothetical protein